MKVLILLSLTALALAADFDMNFVERGTKFVEKVKVDLAGNTEEVDVPKHFDRPAVHLLKDFTQGLKAEKVPAKKECYISYLTKEDALPVNVRRAMILTKGKFPNSRYEIVNNMVLPVGKMTVDQVGAKIAAHCQGYKLVKVLVLNKENIDVIATKMIRKQAAAAQAGRSKRDVTVQIFGACKLSATNNVNGCPPNKLAAVCRFVRQDSARCVYSLNCPMTDTGFRCTGTHVFSSPTCCDFTCNR